MAEIIEMPKLSDTMTIGTLVKWLKKEGDLVKNGDMLAEVETDKATMELESFFDGTLLKIFVPAGSKAPIGSPLCAVGKAGEAVPEVAAPASTGGNASPTHSSPPPSSAGAGPVSPAGRLHSQPPSAAPTPATPVSRAAPAAAPVQAAVPEGGRLKISPLARKLAAETGVDLAGIAGTGPGGRIVRADIISAEKAGARAPLLGDSAGPIQEERTVPVSDMRATIARRLVEAKSAIPHFYLDIEVDAGPLLDLRAQLNAALERDGVNLSVNDFLLKASAEALRRVPAANCSWEERSNAEPAIHYFGAANVSFAVAIPDGLITPVIRDAQAKTIFAISAEARSLAGFARAKKLQPPQYTGGTFCVSNLGMMGVDRFCAIVNPPNAAILAVGAISTKPVVSGDRVAIGRRMTLTLSGDHRAIDGAIGAALLAAIKDLLEKPSLLLL